MSFDMEKYISFESLYNTLYFDIKHKCEKISFGQSKRYKKNAVFFRELNSSQIYLLFAIRLQAEALGFISLKLCVGFSIFDSVSF